MDKRWLLPLRNEGGTRRGLTPQCSLLPRNQPINPKKSKTMIKWPPEKCSIEWQQIDEEVSRIILIASKGSTDRRLNILSHIIDTYAMPRLT